MVMRWTLKEALNRAIQKENQSRLLYLSLSDRVKDPAVGEAFQDLAHLEQGHRERLESYLHGEIKEGVLSGGQVIEYQIAEKLEWPEISADMTLKEAFQLAVHWEQESHELYLNLAQIHPPGPVKNLLEELASQELEHKQRVAALYAQVTFTQNEVGE